MKLKISLAALFLSTPLAFGTTAKSTALLAQTVTLHNNTDLPLTAMITSILRRDSRNRVKHPCVKLKGNHSRHIAFQALGSVTSPEHVIVYGDHYMAQSIPKATRPHPHYNIDIVDGKITITEQTKDTATLIKRTATQRKKTAKQK